MTKIYKYDVFISHSNEDADLAQNLAAKLRQLEFHVWSERKEKNQQSQKAAAAMEDSAVCILLFGPGLSSPWKDEYVWSAITDRIQRTSGIFRVIPVLLTSILRLPGEIIAVSKGRPLSQHYKDTVVRFESGLEDDRAIRQLVLRIRGIDSTKQTIWSHPFLREKVRQRAKNVFNVDWTKLIASLIDTKYDTPLTENVTGDVCSTTNMLRSDRFRKREPKRKYFLGTTLIENYNAQENSCENIETCGCVEFVLNMSLRNARTKHSIGGSYLKAMQVRDNPADASVLFPFELIRGDADKTSTAFLDAATIESARRVIYRGRRPMNASWDRKSVGEATYCIMQKPVRVDPGLGPWRPLIGYVDLLSYVRELEDYSCSAQDVALSETLKYFYKQDSVACAWDKEVEVTQMPEWRDTHKEFALVDHAKRYGGLLQRPFIPFVAQVLKCDKQDLYKIHKDSKDIHVVKNWRNRTVEGEVLLVANVWMVAGMMRHIFHQYAAAKEGYGLISHPFRNVVKLEDQIYQNKLNHAFLFLSNFIVKKALSLNNCHARLWSWVTDTNKVRRDLKNMRVLLPQTENCNEVFEYAVLAAEGQDSDITHDMSSHLFHFFLYECGEKWFGISCPHCGAYTRQGNEDADELIAVEPESFCKYFGFDDEGEERQRRST